MKTTTMGRPMLAFGNWATAPFGELAVHSGVLTLQGMINQYKTAHGEPAIDADGKYGLTTHTALKKMVKWRIEDGSCGAGYTMSMIDSYGPNAVRDCIKQIAGVTILSDFQLDDIQAAWSEWKAGSGGGGGGGTADPYAAARNACAAGGGTWDATNHICTNGTRPPQEDEGMGVVGWLGLTLLGGLLAYGIWYVISED